jgi:predicted RNA-binding protein with PIN domain
MCASSRYGSTWSTGDRIVERVVQLHIEKLPESVYLATSDDVQGLMAQGRTIQEPLEIARALPRS